ncbi:uncharacterized protein LOC125508134 [Triticum urartu]|uniref:DUF538 domain-containing protein n=2 Tax=Triticum TaxID=4564 RepID=A0A8R7QB78_TRIUA|nr:uncharacterized protein LOC119300001 [Triticum dicoccoides]XP_044379888.1 uncharacterized protein LOC123102556 [Triticum aestivum]XP_048528658.1 uncharacterized protein LOC125508112 [Triticum urartu]XP_048528681.1 uncharacterized protein LOC125508126 [Triticum urartu]XP_048528693.1 uncharacterized protein LOC125508134 [Triticum urartu]VAI14062.1 unnamed protein product [Triticum turgidum subsp. durum]
MPMLIPDDVRAKAEIYTGDAAGQEKTRLMLAETELPSGLLPLKDIIECGYVEETGFVWLKQKKRVDHYFAKAGRHVSYATEVSAIAEKGRLKKISGVKAKEMLIWVNLHEICVDDPPTGKLHCKAIGGLSRSFPVEAFEATDALPVPVTGRLKKKTEKESADQKDEKKKEEEAEKPKGAAVAPAPAAVDEIGQKMKEMNTEAPVQAEAVAAKN